MGAATVNVGGARAADGGLGLGNLISGNGAEGIRIGGSRSTPYRSVVAGNYIGTNASGTAAIGNDAEGVLLLKADDTQIGTGKPGEGNLISGNGASGLRIAAVVTAFGLGLIRESNDPTRDVQTAARLVTSVDVARKAVSKLDTERSPRSLLADVKAVPIAQSNLVAVTAKGATPESAQNLANVFGESVVEDRTEKLHAQLDDAIKQSFNGSQEKYQEYIKKYGLTDEEVREFLVRPSVVQKKVQDKLTGDQKISDADVQKYYDENKDKPPISTPDTRDVQFILTGSRADALAAEKALSDGEDWDKVAKRYAIPPGPPSTGGDFTATKGQLETNFGNAVFGDLATGDVSGLIPVSEAYESSNLSGKCKPDCFFIVKPKSDVKPGGQQSFDDVKAQIRQTLEQTQVLDKARTKFNSLLAAQKKLTHYNPAYKPAATTAASSGAAPTT